MFYWTAIYRHQTAYSHKTMLNFSFLSVSETIKVLKLSLTEFSLPKFYQLFGISKVKCAAVSAFRSTYRHGDRSFAYTPPEQERLSLQSLEVITDALLEIMEVREEMLTHCGLMTPCGDEEWRLKVTWIWVNISSGNGLLPDGTKPLPEPMLTCHQMRSVAFTWKQFSQEVLMNLICKMCSVITVWNTIPAPRD